MKKWKAFLFTLVLFFVSSNYVYAVCDVNETNELNSLATNVNVSYEIVQVEIPKDENFNYPDGMTEEERAEYVAYDNYFRIHISNLTEDLYVVVRNENTGESTTYNYQDSSNGTITFDRLVTMEIVNYTITIYSSSETNCADTELYTQYLTTPMYNPYSELVLCEGIEDFYLCQEYLSVDVDFTYFYDDVERYRNGLINDDGEEIPEEEDPGFFDFVRDNIVIIIVVVVVIVAAGGLITFVVIRKQRRRIV